MGNEEKYISAIGKQITKVENKNRKCKLFIKKRVTHHLKKEKKNSTIETKLDQRGNKVTIFETVKQFNEETFEKRTILR